MYVSSNINNQLNFHKNKIYITKNFKIIKKNKNNIMKGTYALIINLKKDSIIKIGKKLGKINFKKGYYIYVGSAMNGLESRLKRHLSNEKKLHWHIDYLLKNNNSEIIEILYTTSTRKIECNLSEKISDNAKSIPDFGCSDCECESHLHYFENKKEAIENVENAYDSIAIPYFKR